MDGSFRLMQRKSSDHAGVVQNSTIKWIGTPRYINYIIYLGNVITNLPPNTKLGPGLARNIVTEKIITSESGILKLQNGFAFIEGAKKRYIPSKGKSDSYS